MKKQILDDNQLSVKGPYKMVPLFITIHEVNSCLGAQSVADYLHKNNGVEGYHVLVDEKEEIQVIPFERNAWHAGDGKSGVGNRQSISIGICRANDYKSNKYEISIKQAVKTVAKIAIFYNVQIENIVQHNHWSNEDCPHRIRQENRWIELMISVKEEMKKVSDTNWKN